MAIMNGKINDRLVEPLWSYELTEDGGRITMRIPGLFNGKPDSPELYYNGRKHAFLVRNKDRVLLVTIYLKSTGKSFHLRMKCR